MNRMPICFIRLDSPRLILLDARPSAPLAAWPEVWAQPAMPAWPWHKDC